MNSHNVEWKKIPGKDPVLYLLNRHGEVIEVQHLNFYLFCWDYSIFNYITLCCSLQSVDMSAKSRDQCNLELLERGFYKKQDASEQVPPGVADPPYRPANKVAAEDAAGSKGEL